MNRKDVFIEVLLSLNKREFAFFQTWIQSGYWGLCRKEKDLISFVDEKRKDLEQLSRKNIERSVVFETYKNPPASYQQTKEVLEEILIDFMHFLSFQPSRSTQNKVYTVLEKTVKMWEMLEERKLLKKETVRNEVQKEMSEILTRVNKMPTQEGLLSEEYLSTVFRLNKWSFSHYLRYDISKANISAFADSVYFYNLFCLIQYLVVQIDFLSRTKTPISNEIIFVGKLAIKIVANISETPLNPLLRGYSSLLSYLLGLRSFDRNEFAKIISQELHLYATEERSIFLTAAFNVFFAEYQRFPQEPEVLFQILAQIIDIKGNGAVTDVELYSYLDYFDEYYYHASPKNRNQRYTEIKKLLTEIYNRISGDQSEFLKDYLLFFQKSWEGTLINKDLLFLLKKESKISEIGEIRRKIILLRGYYTLNKRQELETELSNTVKNFRKKEVKNNVRVFYLYLKYVNELKTSEAQAELSVKITKTSYFLNRGWLIDELKEINI